MGTLVRHEWENGGDLGPSNLAGWKIPWKWTICMEVLPSGNLT